MNVFYIYNVKTEEVRTSHFVVFHSYIALRYVYTYTA